MYDKQLNFIARLIIGFMGLKGQIQITSRFKRYIYCEYTVPRPEHYTPQMTQLCTNEMKYKSRWKFKNERGRNKCVLCLIYICRFKCYVFNTNI